MVSIIGGFALIDMHSLQALAEEFTRDSVVDVSVRDVRRDGGVLRVDVVAVTMPRDSLRVSISVGPCTPSV